MLDVNSTRTKRRPVEDFWAPRSGRKMETFTCIDCNCIVYSYPIVRPGFVSYIRDRCSVCQWIHDIPNITKEQEAEIRLMTATPILEKEDGQSS